MDTEEELRRALAPIDGRAKAWAVESKKVFEPYVKRALADGLELENLSWAVDKALGKTRCRMPDAVKYFNAIVRNWRESGTSAESSEGQLIRIPKLEFARRLRKNMTPAERMLWCELKSRQLGVKFRRQSIILGYIADFYCVPKALVVEVDGPIHEAEKDLKRDEVMLAHGIKTLRFTNDDVMSNVQSVVNEIVGHL